MYTLKGTVLIKVHDFFFRMLFIICRLNSKLGDVTLKNRSLDQITEKLCVHNRGYSFVPKLMKLCQNVNPHKI